MLALKDRSGLKFYIRPNFAEFTSEHDRSYFAGLIDDLIARSKRSPEAVFKQVSELSAGPLLADEVIDIEDSEKAISERFPELEILP